MSELRSRRRGVFSAVAAVVFVLAVGTPLLPAAEDSLPLTPAESVGMSSERLQRINRFVQKYIDTDQIAGAVTLVARRGKVVHYEAQGWRYKEEKIPMSPDTIFAIVSMTKPIVSTALMMLFEEGHFQLDDPISKWLPEYKDHQVRIKDGQHISNVPEARPVTVRHLLTHTSGLTLNPKGMGLSEAQLNEATNDGKGFDTLGEWVRHAAVIPGHFQPGDEWKYGSSTDYVAVLVEKISEMSINDFLHQRIFDPLGMVDTYYYVPREKIDRMAAIYQAGDDDKIVLTGPPSYREPTQMFRGIAGLYSTAADYYRFAQMIANGGEFAGTRLLGRMTVNNMITNHIGTGKPVYVARGGYGFGLGFGVLTNPAEAPDALSIGSYTWTGYLGTLYWADPVEDLIGILMIHLEPHGRTFNLRSMYSNVVTQAVIDSLADQRPKVMGYATPK